MGSCVGSSRNLPARSLEEPKIPLERPSALIHPKEVSLLKMIYQDLSLRNPNHEVDHETFLLFFQKNGYWGHRLFKEFDTSSTNLITEPEFIRGIVKIFKTSEDQKIELLFKFFSGSSDKTNGVGFPEFLTMLYNYPKQDFKKILNDEEFFNGELRKDLIAINSIHKGRRLDSICSNDTTFKEVNLTTFRVEETDFYSSDHVSSRVGSDLLKGYETKCKAKSTIFKIKVGSGDVEVATTNMHHLVRKFAISIFKSYGISTKLGKLEYGHFRDWMLRHKQLYNTYYQGFRSEVWQINKETLKPIFMQKNYEITSEGRIYENSGRAQKITLALLKSILIVWHENDQENPIFIICLDGLSAKKIFQQEKGSGIEISHRDEVYPDKRFYLKDDELADKWMEVLKFYKGCSINMLYEMGEKIGVGKFSVVYSCVQNQSNEKYAIKVIETSKLEDQAKKLIAHESSIMSIVSHPMLLTLKESLQTKAHLYIVTELVDGKDMLEFVKDSKYLCEEKAAFIIRQILVGVKYLHSLGIVHRDLKPENIMIEYDEQTCEINKIKIIDFGFANYLERLKDLSPEEKLAGTPNYIAPQLLRLDRNITQKIDNFSIGSILYFALSGNLAFNGKSIKQILQRTLDGDYQINDKRWKCVSNEAKDLINKLLENEQNYRITTEEALSHPWFTNFPGLPQLVQDENQIAANPQL